MSLGIVADDKEEKVPSYSQEETEQNIKKELDNIRVFRIKPELTWKGEHTFELPDDPMMSAFNAGRVSFGALSMYMKAMAQPEPEASATTTTTTTAGDHDIPYNMKSRYNIIEDFPAIAPEAKPSTAAITTGETKAEVSVAIREAPTFNLGYPDSDDDSIPELAGSIPDDEKPNTTATTTTTTSTATDTNPSLLVCRREGTKTEAVCQELQAAAPDVIIFSSSKLRYLKANDLPARFEDPVGGGVGAPVATAVVVASTPTETKASETEDFYAALDKERSAWKQGPPAPWSRWHFDAHLLRPTPTPQDEEAMRKVGLPPLGWMCTTCSRYFDYPSTVCAHAWRPYWPGGGPFVEEVD